MRWMCPAFALVLLAACSGGSAGKYPRLELTPQALVADIETTYAVSITNSGDAPLTLLSKPVLASAGCPDDPVGTEPFALVLPEGIAFPARIAPAGQVGAFSDMSAEVQLTVVYTPVVSTCERKATLTIASDDRDRPTVVLELVVRKGEPNIDTSPSQIMDLGFVVEGTSIQDTFMITNTGLDDLHVTSITFLGASGFSLQWPCVRKDGSATDVWLPVTAQGTTIGANDCETITIPKNSVWPLNGKGIPVKYQAADANKAVATVILMSDDPDYDVGKGEGLNLELRANYGGPCVRVVPTPLEFGTVVVGGQAPSKTIAAYLESCGDQDVAITSISMSEDSSPDFKQPDLSAMGAFNEANPLVLVPGQNTKGHEFLLTYFPLAVDTDAEGNLVPDTGTLIVKNSSPAQQLKVPMKGLGIKAECAVCDFKVHEGTRNGPLVEDGGTIEPMYKLSFLFLDDESYDKATVNNGIKRRQWSVDPPALTFDPNPLNDTVKVQPNTVGTYTFTLEVENNQGCIDTCSKTISVVPPQGCHIELTWSTPTDPDETDQCGTGPDAIPCGSDMDLHVVHPKASSPGQLDPTGEPYGYFDSDYDCYWSNANPPTGWWSTTQHDGDPLYLPHLDRDDTDGAGPENFTQTFVETGLCYRVGVHYYDDHGFGKSYPTLRVFINSSTPVYEKTVSKGLSMLDMWDVGRVCCTDPDQPFVEFKGANLDPVIVKKYISPN